MSQHLIVVEQTGVLDPGHKAVGPVGGVDALALTLDFRRESGFPRVGQPDLHRPQTATAETIAIALSAETG